MSNAESSVRAPAALWPAVRRWALTLHRWLGLTSGIVFAIAAGTGAVLVYADELDLLLAGPRFHTTPGVIPADQIEPAVTRQVPGAQVLRVIWPSDPANTFGVRYMDGVRQRDLVLDAGSGQVITPRAQHIFLVLTRRLHAGLLMGPTGGLIVLAASAASVVSLLLGLVLWWPGIRHVLRGLRLRMRRGSYIATLDVHQVLGTLALPLLLVMTLTGLVINPSVHALLSRLLQGAAPAAEWAHARAVSAPAGTPLDVAGAARIGNRTTGGEVHYVQLPATPVGIVEVRARSADGAHRLALDPRTGQVIVHQRLPYAPETNARLHFGQIGGPLVRALYAIACVAGFSLLPTGVTLWWLKRRRSRPSFAVARHVRRSSATSDSAIEAAHDSRKTDRRRHAGVQRVGHAREDVLGVAARHDR